MIKPSNLEEYLNGMVTYEKKFGKETCNQLKRAKILFQGSLNVNLADIINIYASVLFVTLKDFKDFNLENIYNAMFDLDCSVGQINIFEQSLLRKYDLGEPILHINESTINFAEVLENTFTELESLINSNEKSILSTNFKEGDKMGGEGSGSYNDKYIFFYLIRLFITNKSINRKINIKKEILEHYERVISNFKVEGYEIKYFKYKTKYLLLKKNIGL